MNKDIKNFVKIKNLKNGKIKLYHNISNEINIYKLIRLFGFRLSKINGKRIYYLRINEKNEQTNFEAINDRFFQFLKNEEYENNSNEISNNDVINWFFEKNPIRRNNLLRHHLTEELSNSELHELLLQINSKYESEFRIKRILESLRKWKFENTVDSIGSFSKDADLYFKHIDQNDFIVFNHFNKHRILLSGFDAWKAKFSHANQIGKKLPIAIEEIKLSFEIDRDLKLVTPFLD